MPSKLCPLDREEACALDRREEGKRSVRCSAPPSLVPRALSVQSEGAGEGLKDGSFTHRLARSSPINWEEREEIKKRSPSYIFMLLMALR